MNEKKHLDNLSLRELNNLTKQLQDELAFTINKVLHDYDFGEVVIERDCRAKRIDHIDRMWRLVPTFTIKFKQHD